MESRPSTLLRLLFSFGCGLLGIVLTLIGYLLVGLLTFSSQVDALGHQSHNPIPHFWTVAPFLLPCGFALAALLGWRVFGRPAE
jgi:H+/Cl- antiporter ClcA